MATGPDQIPARILKDLNGLLNKDVCSFINASYRLNFFPSRLKHAVITPIYKDKGNHNSPDFYRPISILSILSKIFERAATSQITEYLEKYNLLFQGQHAYRKSHSTATSLIETMDFIHKQLDRGYLVGLVSTDLSKAFDTLSHDLLLNKLKEKGFTKHSTAWLKSYLTERTQQVKMHNVTSSVQTVEAGVPQGSILGPILFITFTADFQDHLSDHKVTAYADDTQILITARNEEELKNKVESSIRKAQLWYSTNSLKINPAKTEILVLGRKNTQSRLNFTVQEGKSSTSIENSNKMKILGVLLDEKLTWEHQVKSVKAKTFRIIRKLARTAHILPMSSRRQLYDALVTPHFSYCDTVWGGLSKGLSMELQKAGNFAARSLLGLKKRASATFALVKLNMMPLEQKRMVHTGVLVHKIRKGTGPAYLLNEYGMQSTRGHQTRSKTRGDMKTLSHNTAKYERSTLQRATQTWNSIPVDIRNIENTSNFKRKYQGHLLNRFKQDAMN